MESGNHCICCDKTMVMAAAAAAVAAEEGTNLHAANLQVTRNSTWLLDIDVPAVTVPGQLLERVKPRFESASLRGILPIVNVRDAPLDLHRRDPAGGGEEGGGRGKGGQRIVWPFEPRPNTKCRLLLSSRASTLSTWQ